MKCPSCTLGDIVPHNEKASKCNGCGVFVLAVKHEHVIAALFDLGRRIQELEQCAARSAKPRSRKAKTAAV